MILARAARVAAVVLVVLALVGVPWDADLDGAWTIGPGPHDCDDRDAAIHPGAVDVPLDGIDQDCDGHDSARGSSVVLITIDTLRARNLGAYGYDRPTSPHIDALASEGALFLHAYSSSSWTIPSLASLLTSRHPSQHRTVLARSALPVDLPFLPDLLQAAGYDTAVYIQSAYPLLTMGFARGFDLMDRPAGYKTPQILQWLREHQDRPFFLWVHYAEPHTPYRPSRKYDGLFVPERLADHPDIARYWNRAECEEQYDDDPDAARLRMGFYDERIREADDKVGQILRELDVLGLRRKTLVVLSADHGEEFFEHRGCDHGQTFYDEVLHVPLVMRHPSLIHPHTRVPEQVRTIDVAPTILDALEMPIPASFVGRSLLPLTRHDGVDRPVTGGFLSNSERAVVIRAHGFKYVWSPNRTALRQRERQETEELYDLRADPGERRNLASSAHPRLRLFREKARRWMQRPRPAGPAPTVHFDPATAARLRALGYLEQVPAAAAGQ